MKNKRHLILLIFEFAKKEAKRIEKIEMNLKD
jgi:hypothetical protein